MYNSSPTYYIEEGVFLSVLINKSVGKADFFVKKVQNKNVEKNKKIFKKVIDLYKYK